MSSSSSRLNAVSRHTTDDQVSHLRGESKHDIRAFSSAEVASARRTTSERKVTSSSQRRVIEKVKTTTTKLATAKITSPDRSTRRDSHHRGSSAAVTGASSQQRSGIGPKVDVTQVTQSWDPQVCLVPHTTAPLASRVSNPPLASQAPDSLEPTPFHQMTLESQEAAIIDDLLSVLMGYEGQHIRFTRDYDPSVLESKLAGPTFKIHPGLDPTLRDLTISILKVATHFMAIEAFIEVHSKLEYGLVNHALSAAMRKLLYDYLVVIVQLETQFLTAATFTLHVLNLHLLPTSRMIEQLHFLALDISKRNSLLEETEDSDREPDNVEAVIENLRAGGEFGLKGVRNKITCKGGSVLRIITERLFKMSGDPAAKALLSSLLRDASRPYVVMLNEWLHRGTIRDPHTEFLVREQSSIRRERLEEDYTDEYWDRRYTIRDHGIPPQLEEMKEKVLLAGKYLNVVRECSGSDIRAASEDLPRSFDDHRFVKNIDAAYAHANAALLRLLLTTHALPARMRSLKYHFFLDQADCFLYFLELAASELRKPVDRVNIVKLQSLLDLALRQPGRIAAHDLYQEDIRVEMNKVSLQESLTRVLEISGIESGEQFQHSAAQPSGSEKAVIGFSSLQLDYSLPFPLSLVIGRKAIWRYQVLFRYLLSLRNLEHQLTACWQIQNKAPCWAHASSDKRLLSWKRRAFTLRARMLVFVQQLLYFCTSEVIEPNWQALMDKITADRQENPNVGEQSIGTVDELMKEHINFLDTCLKESMLTNSKLLKVNSKLIHTCTLFASFTSWFSRALENNDPDLSRVEKPATMNKQQWMHFQNAKVRHESSTPSAASSETAAAQAEKMHDLLAKCEFNFNRNLQILIDALNHYAATETVVLLGLCAKLSMASEGIESGNLEIGDDART